MRRTLLLISIFLLTQCAADRDQFYTVDDFERVEKTDVHVHIFADRDDFYEQATRDNFNLITVALDADNNLDSVKEQFQYSLLQKQKHPESIGFATAFSMEGWDDPAWLDQTTAWLDSGINAGAVAVKIWKNIGMVYRDKAGKLIMIDDARFDPIFKMLAERKITLFGHLGEPKNCWLPLEEMTTRNDSTYFSQQPQYHMYKHPELPSYEEQIAARDRMLEKNPEITFVGAHMGSLEWDVDALAKRLDKFPNMAVDLAARMGQVFFQAGEDREKVRDFFIKYQDRLLYATDMGDDGKENVKQLQQGMHETWLRDWRFFATDETMSSNLVRSEFQGLKLPAPVVDKIFNLNAKKWFNVFESAPVEN